MQNVNYLQSNLMKPTRLLLLTIFAMASSALTSCSNDEDDVMAQVRVNGTVLIENGDDYNGDVDGDFTGNGGTSSKTFSWNNALTTAEYNADITSSIGGGFKMTVMDADGKSVLDRSLNSGTEPDSFSGVTSAGAAGIWSVTISLTTFNGEGSFSISEGN